MIDVWCVDVGPLSGLGHDEIRDTGFWCRSQGKGLRAFDVGLARFMEDPCSFLKKRDRRVAGFKFSTHPASRFGIKVGRLLTGHLLIRVSCKLSG